METSAANITSVRELVDVLRKAPKREGYLGIMKSLAIPDEDLQRFCSWNKSHYTRNCLLRTADVELLLICWERGQQSPIHDFDAREVWVRPVYGRLKEERFVLRNGKPYQVSSLILDETGFSYMTEPVGLHRYSNGYESRAVSLNLYSEPVDRWNEYDEKDEIWRVRQIRFDTVFRFNEDNSYECIEV